MPAANGRQATPELRGAPRELGDDWAEIRDLLRQRLLAGGRMGEMGHLGMTLVLTLVFWAGAIHQALILWVVLIGLATAWRIHLRRRIEQGVVADPDLVRFRVAVALVAAAWATGPVVLGASLTLPDVLLLMVIVAGLVAVGTSTFNPDPPSYWIFKGILAGALAIGILRNGHGRLHLVALLLLVLYVLLVGIMFVRSHTILVEGLRSKLRAERSEAHAKAERAFLRTLLGSSPTAIVTLDSGGTVLEVNPAFEKMFGFRQDEVRGASLNDHIVPPGQRREALRLETLVAADGALVTEQVRQRRDGSRVNVRISAAREADRSDGAMFVLYDDITQMKRAEQQLRDAEAQYRSLVDSASDLVWQLDREGRWTFVNPTSEVIYGLPPEALVGQPFTDLVHPDHLAGDFAAFRRVLEGEALSDHETVHRDATGEGRHLSFSARPLKDPTGKVVGASGVARDVTERAQIRQALEEARREAERNAEAKSAFLANMSHEIRTPMNGILGMVELLLDTGLDDGQQRAAQLIKESGDALMGIINDILDFSKIEAGRVDLEETEFEPAGLIDSAVRLLGVKAFERGLELICQVDETIPQVTLGDPGRIRQVLNNLIGNAIKFTHQGEVTVSARLAGLQGDVARIHFAVRDTGIGIAADKLDTIFEEFSQADVSTTRKYGGTGLGLSITRRLVGLMGGQLKVTSRVGQGSEFSFTLPLKVGQDRPGATPAPVLKLTGVRTLIIDDNATNRRIVRDMLRPTGVDADEAADGPAGLDLVFRAREAGRPYQLVILDGQMPGMDGFEVAARIRERSDLRDTRLMMFTSGGRPGDGARCRELGVTGYLSKPASRTELLETVAAVLRGPASDPGSPKLVTRHLIQEQRTAVRVLLAEDNLVNQTVARTMLTKRGHHVVVANHGQEALDALARETFDVVLMDVQMPVMDGLTATRAIRAFPQFRDLPIIAVTAHALQEERQRCADAGMTGYLAKPFKPHDLFAVVERWGTEADSDSGSAPAAASAPVDLAGFRAAMEEAGVGEAVDAMLDVFLRDAPERMASLETALDARDPRTIEATAHAFKSAAGTIGAKRLAELLKTIEFAGRNQEPELARASAEDLRTEYASVMTYLHSTTGASS